jgi:hypothetical protein
MKDQGRLSPLGKMDPQGGWTFAAATGLGLHAIHTIISKSKWAALTSTMHRR